MIPRVLKIQGNDPTGKNTIVVEGKEYKLLQVHFHTPTENTINGEHFAMEGHLVHQNANGGLVVIGFMLKVGMENQQSPHKSSNSILKRQGNTYSLKFQKNEAKF